MRGGTNTTPTCHNIQLLRIFCIIATKRLNGKKLCAAKTLSSAQSTASSAEHLAFSAG